jgi:PAS domain S-box-containing protein
MEQDVLTTITLATSALLLIVAATIAICLIRATGWRLVWSAVAATMLLLSFVRGIALYDMVVDGRAAPVNGMLELAALGAAIVLGLAAALTAPHVVRRDWAEAAIRRSRQQFRDVVDGSLQGMVVYRDSKPLFANQAFADIFGFRNGREVVAQSSVREFEAEHERAARTAIDIRRLRGAEVPARCEFDGLRKDGSAIQLESSALLVEWNGEPAVQLTVIDITERKRSERARQEAERLAEEASAASSEFLAKVNHELRSPLNAVIGFSQIIENGPRDEFDNGRFADYAGDIRYSGETLLDLVNDALDLSRVEAGQATLEEENVDVNEVVGECLAEIDGRASARSVMLESSLPSTLLLIYADRSKLKRILLSVLANSVETTAGGGGVWLEVNAGMGQDVTFQVFNSGAQTSTDDSGDEAGFPEPEEAHHTFGNELSGSGLGIMLAKSLVELHGGTFDLQCVPGIGAITTASFPAARVVQPSDDADADAGVLQLVG